MGLLRNYLSGVNDKLFNVVLDWRHDYKNNRFVYIVKRGGIIKDNSLSLPSYEIVVGETTKKYDKFTDAVNYYEKQIHKYSVENKNFRINYLILLKEAKLHYPKVAIMTEDNRKKLFNEIFNEVIDERINISLSLTDNLLDKNRYEEGIELLHKIASDLKKENKQKEYENILELLDFL